MLKNELRKQAKLFRKNLSLVDKINKDKSIFKKVVNTKEYLNSKIVLCYYSSEYEVDTVELIKHSLLLNKKVALPKCIDLKGNMVFKYINDLTDLEIGSFSLLEPNVELPNYEFFQSNAICIIPALMVDLNGYRLGYGKGYYDKFLKNFKGFKCALCYKENVVKSLPIFENFDIKCDLFLTD